MTVTWAGQGSGGWRGVWGTGWGVGAGTVAQGPPAKWWHIREEIRGVGGGAGPQQRREAGNILHENITQLPTGQVGTTADPDGFPGGTVTSFGKGI